MDDLPDDPAYLEGRAAGWETGYEAAVTAAREAGARLAARSRALVESVYSDNANHGDILSRETIAAANALHIELGSWKK